MGWWYWGGGIEVVLGVVVLGVIGGYWGGGWYWGGIGWVVLFLVILSMRRT